MDFEEYLDQLHKFREKRSGELAKLSPEERREEINRRGRELAEKYGLKITKPTKTVRS